jgi:hypothetical protein
MSRITEEADKLIEDLAKAELRFLKKIGKRVEYTERELYELGRYLALVCVSRNLKKLKFRKRRIQGFGYEWQVNELIKREKDLQRYLKVNAMKYADREPKDF